MRKYVKGCIGFFVFIITFIICNNVVYAETHPRCSSEDCVPLSVISYICPNTGADDKASALACYNAMKSNSSSLTAITNGDTIPLMYDEANSKSTLIAVKLKMDISGLDQDTYDITDFKTTWKYDATKFDILVAIWKAADFDGADYFSTAGSIGCTLTKQGTDYMNLNPAPEPLVCQPTLATEQCRTTTKWKKAGSDGWVLKDPPYIEGKDCGTIPGQIKTTLSATGDIPLVYEGDFVDPLYAYIVFKVKDDIEGGSTTIEPYQPIENPDTSIEYVQFSYDGGNSDLVASSNPSTFTLGNSVTIQKPISNIKVYSDSTKTKEYHFGVPGTTYTNSTTFVTFNESTGSYDLYLPSGTESIYIDVSTSEGGVASGDVGTKVLSTGTADFTITGTNEDGVSNYTITYHVPNNKLGSINTPGTFASPNNTFLTNVLNYTLYLKPTEKDNVSITPTIADTTGFSGLSGSTGGLSTKLNDTDKTAKTKANSITDTIASVADGDVYKITSYGAECFGAYNTALGECNSTEYTITYKLLDRTLSSIYVRSSKEAATEYGVKAADFNSYTKTYTVYVPHSETSVLYGGTVSDSAMTAAVAQKSKALSDGDNVVTIVTEPKEASSGDTFKETYTIHIYRLSEDASLDTFTSTDGSNPIGTLGEFVDTVDGSDSNMAIKTATLTVGSTINSTKFTTTATSETAYVKAVANTQTLAEDWTINTSTPYEVTIFSESCKTEYESIPNNVCKKTKIVINAEQKNGNANLASISVRPNQTSSTEYTVVDKGNDKYSVTVPSTSTSVFVGAVAADASNAEVKFIDGSTESDLGTVNISSENTTKKIRVKAQDRTIYKDYELTIHRASTEAKLKSLSVKDGTKELVTFNAETETYDIKLENDPSKTSVVVNAEAEYANAKLNGTETSNTNKITNDTWTFDSNPDTYNIVVYPESCQVSGDACVTKTYKVTMNRYKTISHVTNITVKKADNTTLRSFTITDSDPTSYTVGIPSTENSAIIEVTKADSSETVKFNTDATENLTRTISSLNSGNNEQTIHVESEYGDPYKKDYKVNLYKVSDDTSLTFTSTVGIGSNPISVDETDSTKFNLKVLNTAASTSITSTAATTAYIGTEATGNTKTETWTFTNNNPDTYTVTVYPERCKAAYNNGTACTSTDGVTYTLTKVTVSNETKPNKIIVKSETGSETYGTIDFTGETQPSTPYKVNIPAGVTGVKIEVEGKSGQTVSLPGTDGVVTGLGVGDNNQTIGMQASDGTTEQPYVVNIYRPSTDKVLTALSVASPATLDPAFATTNTNNTYTVKVSDNATSVSVSATSSTNSFITIESNGNSITNASWNVSAATPADYVLKVFPETCKAEFATTACTDSDATIYTLQLQKLSSDKTLTGISVNGTPATWDSTDSKWKVAVPATATSATITCNATAPMSCTDSSIASLTDGTNNGSVSVTAEDGSTGTANVEVYRVANKIGIDGITFSNGSLKETSTPDGTYTYTARFSTTKTSSTVVPTPKYNGFVDGTLSDWDLTGTPANYTFKIKSESCKTEYATDSAIAATCVEQDYTVQYEAISASGTLGSISVKGQDNVEYFTDTISGFNYTVYVPSTVSSATITVTPEVTGTMVSPNTQTIANVVEGANTPVSIVVTPEDTSIQPNTYTITVYKLNDNAELKSLSASPNGTIAALSSGTYNYDLVLTDGTVTSTNISAEANYAKAKLRVNSETTSVEKEITNKTWTFADSNTFTIEVKSESCDHQSAVLTTCVTKEYVITKKVLSDVVILNGLAVKNTAETSEYAIDPTFSNTVTSYKAELPSGSTTAAIIIDPGTTGITISGQSVDTGGSVAIDSLNKNKINASGLKVGDNIVTINLLAENGTTPGTYTVNLYVKSNDTTLTLTADPGNITGTGTNLTLNVANGVTSSDLTATIPTGASLIMNGTNKVGTTATDTWSGFTNGDTYTITVTPEDGDAVTYTVTVNVAAPDESSDNSITSISADPGSISSTTCSGGSCTLTVPYGTTSTDITVTSAAASKVTMNGVAKDTNTGTETWSGFSAGDTFTIVVKAENGDDATYTVTVAIDEPTTEDKDSSLKSITVTKTDSDPAVTYTVFEPTFIPGSTSVKDYTIFVPYETTKIDLAAEANNESVTPVFSNQNGIVLAVGDNFETISVTSKDNSATTVYNVNVYRISNDARLDNFAIGAANIDPTFSSDTYEYTAFISKDYPSTSVTYALKYNRAYVESETNTTTSATWNFNDGANTEFTLHTYAESCKAKFSTVEGNTCVDKEYKITATFFSPKITSDVYKLNLETFNDGTVDLDIIVDFKLYSKTDGDLKGEQTDNPEAYLKLYLADDSAEVPTGDPLATGMILKLIIVTTEYDRRLVVVPGDVNGDAEVDVSDILYIVDHTLDTVPLTGPYLRAGDYNDDTEVDVTDILDIVDFTLS